MPGRSVHSDKYRYGFNGKEKDDDLHSLTAYDYGFRIYNPALGRFLSVDPLTRNFPMLTSYQFSSNMPIACIDLDGLESFWSIFGLPTGLAQSMLETPCGREMAESFYKNVKGTLDGFINFFDASKRPREGEGLHQRMVELGFAPATAGVTSEMAQNSVQNMRNLAALPEQTLLQIFDHYSKMIKGVVEGDCGALGDLAFELVLAAIPLDEAPRLLKAGVKDFKLLDNVAVAKANKSVLGEIRDELPRIVDEIESGALPSMLKDPGPTSHSGRGTAFRYMTEGELEAIKNTGLLRGGRPGETYFTKDVYRSASKVQSRLALPTAPTLRVEFEILNKPNLLRNSTKVKPDFGMPGKGAEFMTTDPVRVQLINWQPLGK